MSRVGNRPIKINQGVEISVNANHLAFKSAKGELSLDLPVDISAKISDDTILIQRANESKMTRSLHGLYARLTSNAIEGLSNGIKRNMEFKGTGYRVKAEGKKLFMNMGYSHEIVLDIPDGVEVAAGKNTITITGIDAPVVGNFAAKVREVRKPEVYKGKGIKYDHEIIKRKDGKAAQGGKA